MEANEALSEAIKSACCRLMTENAERIQRLSGRTFRLKRAQPNRSWERLKVEIERDLGRSFTDDESRTVDAMMATTEARHNGQK